MSLEEQTSTNTPTKKPTTKGSIGLKDLLIPISIVVAGVFVGAGLSMSGGQGKVAAPTAPAAPTADNTGGASPQDLVEGAGISLSAVEQCVNAGEVADLVQADVDNALATGGRGTPWSIIIGPGGKTYPLNGALPVTAIEQAIELARSEAALGPDGSQTDEVTPVTADDHIKGSLDAPIKIVEYSDFDCPFCGRFHTSMNQVVEKYEDVAWVYRHFPLDQLHPNARTIAQVSECVAELGGNDAFWTFTDGYFAN